MIQVGARYLVPRADGRILIGSTEEHAGFDKRNTAEAVASLIDFACGLSQGLYGKIERVTAKVFLLSPEHVAISGDAAEVEPEVDAAFFGQ